MKKYENPSMEIQKFNDDSVITASGGAVAAKMDEWRGESGATVKKLFFGDVEKYSD